MAYTFVDLLRAVSAALTASAPGRSAAVPRRGPATIAVGPYQVGALLGRGGVCTVHRATRADDRRPVALKLLHGQLASPEAAARFEREIRLTSALTHPNTVRILDWGRAANGTLYYAMEYLPGITLLDLLERYGPQPDGRVIHTLRQIAAALAEAHGAGLVHRDLKPANLMLDPSGPRHDRVKVLDFGLGRRFADLAEVPLAGTPGYLAPELLAGAPPSPASDLYALGVVGRELLRGAVGGAAGPEGWASPRLLGLVARCAAPDPADRPGAAALIALLDGCRPGLSWTADDAYAWWHRRANYTPTEPQQDSSGAPPAPLSMG